MHWVVKGVIGFAVVCTVAAIVASIVIASTHHGTKFLVIKNLQKSLPPGREEPIGECGHSPHAAVEGVVKQQPDVRHTTELENTPAATQVGEESLSKETYANRREREVNTNEDTSQNAVDHFRKQNNSDHPQKGDDSLEGLECALNTNLFPSGDAAGRCSSPFLCVVKDPKSGVGQCRHPSSLQTLHAACDPAAAEPCATELRCSKITSSCELPLLLGERCHPRDEEMCVQRVCRLKRSDTSTSTETSKGNATGQSLTLDATAEEVRLSDGDEYVCQREVGCGRACDSFLSHCSDPCNVCGEEGICVLPPSTGGKARPVGPTSQLPTKEDPRGRPVEEKEKAEEQGGAQKAEDREGVQEVVAEPEDVKWEGEKGGGGAGAEDGERENFLQEELEEEEETKENDAKERENVQGGKKSRILEGGNDVLRGARQERRPQIEQLPDIIGKLQDIEYNEEKNSKVEQPDEEVEAGASPVQYDTSKNSGASNQEEDSDDKGGRKEEPKMTKQCSCAGEEKTDQVSGSLDGEKASCVCGVTSATQEDKHSNSVAAAVHHRDENQTHSVGRGVEKKVLPVNLHDRNAERQQFDITLLPGWGQQQAYIRRKESGDETGEKQTAGRFEGNAKKRPRPRREQQHDTGAVHTKAHANVVGRDAFLNRVQATSSILDERSQQAKAFQSRAGGRETRYHVYQKEGPPQSLSDSSRSGRPLTVVWKPRVDSSGDGSEQKGLKIKRLDALPASVHGSATHPSVLTPRLFKEPVANTPHSPKVVHEAYLHSPGFYVPAPGNERKAQPWQRRHPVHQHQRMGDDEQQDLRKQQAADQRHISSWEQVVDKNSLQAYTQPPRTDEEPRIQPEPGQSQQNYPTRWQLLQSQQQTRRPQHPLHTGNAIHLPNQKQQWAHQLWPQNEKLLLQQQDGHKTPHAFAGPRMYDHSRLYLRNPDRAHIPRRPVPRNTIEQKTFQRHNVHPTIPLTVDGNRPARNNGTEGAPGRLPRDAFRSLYEAEKDAFERYMSLLQAVPVVPVDKVEEQTSNPGGNSPRYHKNLLVSAPPRSAYLQRLAAVPASLTADHLSTRPAGLGITPAAGPAASRFFAPIAQGA